MMDTTDSLKTTDKNATIQTVTILSKQPYKGARDNYPRDQRVINYIFDTWRSVCVRYGYEEYSTPLLEPIELYAAKSGDEIVNEQTYVFEDRGGRKVVIRPEMTPSVSRIVAARRQDIGYPARLFNISNYMRYERPQRGREREFWQLNFDLFGAEGSYADAEIIRMCAEILKQFGASDSMYTIRVNNRELINTIMDEYLGLNDDAAYAMIKLFDRREKLPEAEFMRQAAVIVEESDDKLTRISELLAITNVDDIPTELRDKPSVAQTRQLIRLLVAYGVNNAVFDVTLMRGFDYYSGMVFEFFDNHPNNRRAMFGGGRYDGLVGLFGVDPIATVGVAPGLTTTINFLESHDLLPKNESYTDAYIAVLDDAQDAAEKLADQLRRGGLNIAVDATPRKLDKKIKSASKMDIRHVVFVGERESLSGVYPIKNIVTGRDDQLDANGIVASIISNRVHS